MPDNRTHNMKIPIAVTFLAFIAVASTFAQSPASPKPPVGIPASVGAAPRSQLASFWLQIPNVAAWVHAPLDVVAPKDLKESLSLFKKGLIAESSQSIPTMQGAYSRAAMLADMLLETYAQRTQSLLQATGGSGTLPTSAAMAQWATTAKGRRILFAKPRASLDDAVRSGGGVSKTIPLVNETFPLVTLPPAPASAILPEFDVTPPWIRVQGGGPSGTNFGWGDSKLKLNVAVRSNSDIPVPIKVDCYWVGAEGARHTTALSHHRDTSVSATQPVVFDVVTVALRTNGATAGVLPGGQAALPKGPYRGWIITVHDMNGKRLGSASNGFDRLVP